MRNRVLGLRGGLRERPVPSFRDEDRIVPESVRSGRAIGDSPPHHSRKRRFAGTVPEPRDRPEARPTVPAPQQLENRIELPDAQEMRGVNPGEPVEGRNEEAGVLYEDRSPDPAGRPELGPDDLLERVGLRLRKDASGPSHTNSEGPEDFADFDGLPWIGADEGDGAHEYLPGLGPKVCTVYTLNEVIPSQNPGSTVAASLPAGTSTTRTVLRPGLVTTTPSFTES